MNRRTRMNEKKRKKTTPPRPVCVVVGTTEIEKKIGLIRDKKQDKTNNMKTLKQRKEKQKDKRSQEDKETKQVPHKREM